MIADLLLTVAGMALLVGGGEVMVRGASSLAARLGVSPVAVGLTVVAFGTSAPELAVNVIAAMGGHTELSFGNIFGSNMANIGLIVAITALVKPLDVHSVIIVREVPMMMLASLAAAALGLDAWLSGGVSQFDRGDGIMLLLLFSVFVYYTVGDLVEQRAAAGEDEVPQGPVASLKVSIVQTVVGIAGLVIGGALTVEGAQGVAIAMGISETVIGLTLLAVGTSLPELSASLIATMRGHGDLAIGNVVGSNIFNLLIVLGTTSTIAPVAVPVGGGGDVAIVLALSCLLFVTAVSQQQRIIRTEAALLLVIYVVYIAMRTM